MHPGKRDFFLTILKISDILSMLIALAMSLWLDRLFFWPERVAVGGVAAQV
jgi:hypothetical protein